jgi:hypothetical protein
MNVELWKTVFDVSTVILLFLTFGAGAGVLITSNILSKRQLVENQRQSGQIRQFDKDLTDAKTELSKQQERAAVLEIEALKLRSQMLQQGPRGNLLAGENRRKLVDALRPFSGQQIDVRHSASVIMVNGKVVMSTPIGDDALGLANTLVGVLKDAGWKLPQTPLLSSFQGHGVQVEISHNASRETQRAAEALVASLLKVSLAVSGPFPINDDRAKRVGTDVILPALDENTIILEVMTHP